MTDGPASHDNLINVDVQDVEQTEPAARHALNEILPQNERIAIEQGLTTLMEMLVNKDHETLPKAIVLVDTASRPFLYALKPIVKTVYRMKNEGQPPFIFMKTFQKENDQLRVPEIERADEIVQLLELAQNDQLLFVDDYFGEGKTFRHVKDSFQGKVGMNWFAFLSNRISDRQSELQRENVTIGTVDPNSFDGGPPSAGFTMREFKRDISGVVKTASETLTHADWRDQTDPDLSESERKKFLYVNKSDKADEVSMRLLRRELASIGQRVATLGSANLEQNAANYSPIILEI